MQPGQGGFKLFVGVVAHHDHHIVGLEHVVEVTGDCRAQRQLVSAGGGEL
jgi:hypothetical protein